MSKFTEGPFDAFPWPERLSARVVDPVSPRRLHGYDVEGDLAQHYSFVDTLLLTLTGELPDMSARRAFETALIFASTTSAAEAPAHAALLARLCNGDTSTVIGTAAIGLAQEALHLVNGVAPWLAWLASPSGPVPACARAHSDDDRASMGRLRATLSTTPLVVKGLDQDVHLQAGVIATFYACGIRTANALVTNFVLARLHVAAAEGAAATPGAFRDYPTNLPPFSYVEGT